MHGSHRIGMTQRQRPGTEAETASAGHGAIQSRDVEGWWWPDLHGSWHWEVLLIQVPTGHHER